ncbi:hypothetical protein EXIGLDRAFT_614640 [Exidia glandulosa HHB12029]|uniref:T6SS Phospholipase effector Tle1-like catalytic domain-containing protein n=1 Tax=Exidia glandulosa HHB12029 TaxID=1314781 RepID=A0A165HP51_EXIGL|nr:hypothetical protein EXIGLDRAFT_614640 [Exidia glandulosa HHB12029]
MNERQGRTLVLCFDGTAGQFDGDNTNVVKMFSLLKKDEPDKQLVYYQPGVGTFAKPGILVPAFLWLAKMFDMAVACYLDEHVLGGYVFLMQNYLPGDRIVMFGFSRGAYTTRALAGMLHKVGLLPRDNLHQAPFAYAMYRRNDETGFAQSRKFKQAFSRDVEIDFIGLWDTVSSVGLLRPRRLPFTSSNSTVRTFRHALALDECRARFRPTLWSHTTPSADPTVGTGGRSPMRPQHLPLPGSAVDDHHGKQEIEKQFGLEREFDERSADDSDRWRAHAGSPTPSVTAGRRTDVLEVWFSGNHSDIGGGNVVDTQPHMLSNVPLHWMVREAVLAQTGLLFDRGALARLGMQLGAFALTSPTARPNVHLHRDRLDSGVGGLGISLGVPDTASPALSRSVSRESGAEVDHAAVANAFRPPRGPTSSSLQLNVFGDDALCPWRNELKQSPYWWGLELLPYEYWYQNTRYKWRKTMRPNMGRPRIIPGTCEDPPHVHLSVKQRMETEALLYTPQARWQGEPRWVF